MNDDLLRWMGGGVAENDAEESRSARDRPLPKHWAPPIVRQDGFDFEVDLREAQ